MTEGAKKAETKDCGSDAVTAFVLAQLHSLTLWEDPPRQDWEGVPGRSSGRHDNRVSSLLHKINS
jgi:hypothetical protein